MNTFPNLNRHIISSNSHVKTLSYVILEFFVRIFWFRVYFVSILVQVQERAAITFRIKHAIQLKSGSGRSQVRRGVILIIIHKSVQQIKLPPTLSSVLITLMKNSSSGVAFVGGLCETPTPDDNSQVLMLVIPRLLVRAMLRGLRQWRPEDCRFIYLLVEVWLIAVTSEPLNV